MQTLDQYVGTDWKAFDTRKERDEALLRTVGLYIKNGWTLAGEEG